MSNLRFVFAPPPPAPCALPAPFRTSPRFRTPAARSHSACRRAYFEFPPKHKLHRGKQRRNALGVENRALYDVLDAVEGRCRAKQALVSHPRYPTLYVLSSNRVLERYISPQAIRLILDTLSPQFDFILIDSPAGIEDGFHRAASCAEEALLVTTPHISALRDADRVAGILKSYQFSSVGLIVNQVRRERRRGGMLAPDEIASALRLPLTGVVAEDDKLFRENIVSRSRAFRALAETCIDTVVTRKKRG